MDFSNMTLKEKVLQTFIVTIREINKHGGPKEFFKKYPVGGMYYSKSPDPDIEKKTEMSLLTSLNRLNECKKYSKHHLLVCVDSAQLIGQAVRVGCRSVGGTASEEDAYNLGKMMGMQCNSNGVDWILAPAIDMYYNSSMPFFAMSGDVNTTARLYRQIIRGVQDQGVCATAKHFPGLGTDNTNMHHAPGSNILPFDEWMSSYGYTYQQMFCEDLMCVMTTHTMLKSFDPDKHDGYMPIATYSQKLTQELLKDKLGFNGAVVTDALIMGGMATGDLIAETVQSFKCGADLLLWPPIEAADEIVRLLENGEIPMSRLDDALERINKMRSFREKALTEKSYDTPDPDYATKTSLDILRRGVCLYKNDIDLIPLKPDKKKILILDATADGAPSKILADELISRGFTADIRNDIYDTDFYVCWQDDIDALQADYDIVILNADPRVTDDTHNSLYMMIWASHLCDKKKKIIINYGTPFMAKNYFPEELTLIEANSAPNPHVIKAIVDGLVGDMKFTGNFALHNEN